MSRDGKGRREKEVSGLKAMALALQGRGGGGGGGDMPLVKEGH